MQNVKGIQNIKDKEFVKNTREPAKFNMETFAREYGRGVPE